MLPVPAHNPPSPRAVTVSLCEKMEWQGAVTKLQAAASRGVLTVDMVE